MKPICNPDYDLAPLTIFDCVPDMPKEIKHWIKDTMRPAKYWRFWEKDRETVRAFWDMPGGMKKIEALAVHSLIEVSE